MPETVNDVDRRLTARGAATRARIVASADELMSLKGTAATTLDEVIAASGTSKSQLYRHFADKSALVQAVIELRGSRVLEREEQYLRRVDSFSGLERWCRAILQRVTVRRGALGCELGALSTELSDHDEAARIDLDAHLTNWISLLAAALERMKANNTLSREADSQRLATGIMAAIQGGYVLAQAARDPGPMQIALELAMDSVRAHAKSPGE
ncbi:TetR family transcriptional regulator [Kribbella voronezhensis]|uniref:TetR family transcriptional regulator n=1 Tax=Kribbella voronezhensis TaxID=2512212 RepID=A0A4R7SVF0_9ACTN|nr:TetR/AcrR family transcriptional regulator [Kribbella voronezhensis]TDU83290.1 TetR family transcriptional regulator [Kribbella voronezhensis]